MSVGAIKALVQTLQSSALLTGVTITTGEEAIYSQATLPSIVVVPRGGPWSQCGYAVAVNQGINAAWMTSESLDLYLWAADATSSAVLDSYSAVEDLRTLVLRALMAQAPIGLFWFPTAGEWVRGTTDSYGRAYRLTVSVDITTTDVATVDATATTVTQNNTVHP